LFFFLAKTVGFFIVPSNVIIIVLLIGLGLTFSRYANAGRKLVLGAAVLLSVSSFSPLGKAMLLPLENRFAQCPRAQEHTGVVVLGGVIDGGVWAARGVLEVGSSADRLIAAALLARDYPTLRIMFSGGYGGLLPGGVAEAELAAQLLDNLIGMPRRTLVENRSRDTAENARFSKATIKPQRGEKWLLITSAAHMPRAIGAFRKADFDVEACPVDWTTNGNSDLLWPSVSASGGLGFTDQAVREWIGLTMYWLANRTSEFFPAP
jgi:uncharacterized SAM-binding protein YcdF (DUF218 family)